MKKILASFLLIVMIAMTVPVFADEWDGMSGEEFVDAYVDSMLADMHAEQEIHDRAIIPVEDFANVYKSCILDRLEIKANLGTYASGDFIASVHMTYEIKTSNDKSMIVDFSQTIASGIVEACPEVVEVCVFWEFPQYDVSGKLDYLVNEDGIYLDNSMLPLPSMDNYEE